MIAGQGFAAALVPPADAWPGFAGFLLATLMCTLLGGAVCGGRRAPELRLLAGWGVVCVVLTLWGVSTAASMRWPVWGLAVVALASLARRGNREGWGDVGRAALLTLPLWLVMLPLHAAEIDTWLNLLPNAAYLWDHGVFPTAARPEAWSFLPGAPYDTQLVAFAAAVLGDGFSQAAMSWFNILLACGAGMLLARLLAGTAGRLPWWALAGGFLLAVPLNPGFTPRLSFASYGEWPLAVTLMAAVWLGSEVLTARRAGEAVSGRLVALALVLAAMANTKQSGPGLLLSVAVPLAGLGLAVARRRLATAAMLAAAAVPGLLLYAVWQGFVARAGVAQLTMLPPSAWNIGLLPQILLAMAHDALLKGTFFVLLIFALVGGAVAALRRDVSPRGQVLMLVAGSAVLFNGYLLLTYVVHFDVGMAVQAHSYARYNFQLSLAVMLALVVGLRPVVAPRVAAWSAGARRRAAFGAVALTLLLPVAGMRLLRFDFDVPMPTLRVIAAGVAAHLRDGERIGLILPGDSDDNVASFMRGTLLFTPPRRHPLTFRMSGDGGIGALAGMAQAGFPLVLSTCTPAGLADVPARVPALLRRDGDAWRVVESWRYPPDLGRSKSGMLVPLCDPRG